MGKRNLRVWVVEVYDAPTDSWRLGGWWAHTAKSSGEREMRALKGDKAKRRVRKYVPEVK